MSIIATDKQVLALARVRKNHLKMLERRDKRIRSEYSKMQKKNLSQGFIISFLQHKYCFKCGKTVYCIVNNYYRKEE